MKHTEDPHPRPLPYEWAREKAVNDHSARLHCSLAHKSGRGLGEGSVMARYPSLQKIRARKLRGNQTDVESKLWSQLRGRHFDGLKFRRQHPIGPFIVDLCCVERKLVVELDGSQHAERGAADERRTRNLQRFSYRVLRFWDNEALSNLDGVLQKISEALVNSRPVRQRTK
jgi:very-short-patch-repair endonuclease